MKPSSLGYFGAASSLAAVVLLPAPVAAGELLLHRVGSAGPGSGSYSVTAPRDNPSDQAADSGLDALEAVASRSGKRNGAAEPAGTRALLQRARDIEQRLVAAAHLKRSVEVRLDPSNEVNAWTDGSNITVTAGLFRFVDDDDELASVLAHETGHIAAHHPQKVSTAQIAAVLGTILASAAGGRNAEIGTSVGSMLALKKYSRDEEAEADRIGLGLLERAGYDGSAMTRFFSSLEQLEVEDPGLLNSFMIDHPTTATRIHRLTTYPQLDPDLPANQLQLEQGLMQRGAVFEAALLGRRLAAEYPNDPHAADLAARSFDALKTDYIDLGSSPAPPTSLSAPIPISTLLPSGNIPDLSPSSGSDNSSAFKSMRESVRRAGYGLYDAVDALQGLDLQPRGYNSRYASDVSWDNILQSAWRAVSRLSENLDPAAAALMSVQRGSSLLAASHYPAPDSPDQTSAGTDLLKHILEQQRLAAIELGQASSDARDAGAACAQDMHEIGRGIASIQESLSGATHDTSAFMTPQSALAWFSSGAGGVARLEAGSAIRESSEAQIRLEIGSLDWQSRSLSPVDRETLLQQAAEHLGVKLIKGEKPGEPPAVFRTGAGDSLGEDVLGMVCAAAGANQFSTANPTVLKAPRNGGQIDIPTPGLESATDPVSVLSSTFDIDVIQTIFRPVFVYLRREMDASGQLSQSGGPTPAPAGSLAATHR